jgi:hypothetical protein
MAWQIVGEMKGHSINVARKKYQFIKLLNWPLAHIILKPTANGLKISI